MTTTTRIPSLQLPALVLALFVSQACDADPDDSDVALAEDDQDDAELDREPPAVPTFTIRGEAWRDIALELPGDGVGDLYLSLAERCGAPRAVAGVMLEDLDFSHDGAGTAFTITDVPTGTWYLDAMFDDDGDASRGRGDLVAFRAEHGNCISIEVRDSDVGGIEVVLDSVLDDSEDPSDALSDFESSENDVPVAGCSPSIICLKSDSRTFQCAVSPASVVSCGQGLSYTWFYWGQGAFWVNGASSTVEFDLCNPKILNRLRVDVRDAQGWVYSAVKYLSCA